MQALSQLSYGPTSLRSEIIAVGIRLGKPFLQFFACGLIAYQGVDCGAAMRC